jgi:hypothetical protein
MTIGHQDKCFFGNKSKFQRFLSILDAYSLQTAIKGRRMRVRGDRRLEQWISLPARAPGT